MKLRRAFDMLQVWLYLRGNTGFANVLSRFGTPAEEVPPVEVPIVEDVQDPLATLRTQYTTEDITPPAPLRFTTFDKTFNRKNVIDPRDLAWPNNKLDVN